MSDATDRSNANTRHAGMSESENGQREHSLSEEASQRIGKELKSFYDGLVSEPLPDRFVRLLQQLEEVEKTRVPKKPNDGGAE